MSNLSKPSLPLVLKTTAILIIPIVIVNALLFFLGQLIDAFGPTITTPEGSPITLAAVAIASLIGSLICLGIYLLIRRLSTAPGKWVSRVGYFLLFLSFFNPLAVENGNILTFLTLNAMHVVVALPFIQVFNKLSRTSPTEIS